MFSGGGGVGVGGGGGGGGGVAAGCHRFDNNQGACQAQNMSCAWNSFSFNVSQGVCNDLGQQMMFAGMDMSPPKILGQDSADTSVTYIDIRQFGVKDNPGSLGFGAAVSNITGAAVCRGYPIGNLGPTIGQPTMGSGNATTKFYWYLDTNKNRTDGCNSTSAGGANDTGYEFLIKYVVTSVNGTVNEVKSFYKCSSRTWVLTNVPLSSNRQFMCSINMPSAGESIVGGVMILVDKENLKSFAEYNQTAPTRVFLASANDTYNENSPQDSVTAGFYTPGSADFKFVDCSNPDVKDAKCKNFQKFGFNILEDCKNGLDDDGDGLVDCADPKCRFTPVCASTGQAFNFSANSSDVQAPTVMFSQVDTLPDGAFIKFDTDEPANGSVAFYGNDSSCSLLNVTLVDLGDPSVIFDDYKPFHMAPMDFTTVGQGWTSYSDGGLNNNTQYFYKTMVCDPSGNCATSACQNFTTKTERSYKPFVLKMKLPAGYNVTIPALNYSGNFTKTITNATGGNTTYEVGVKTYSNVTRNVNVTVNCGTQSLTFVGVDVLKPKDIDMSGAFICDPSNAGGPVLGMNSTSKAWNQVMGDLGMGGSSDYLKMTFPVSYTSGATLNWCTDEASNCTNVNQYANCSNGGTGKTDCKVPTSLGFSAYQLEGGAGNYSLNFSALTAKSISIAQNANGSIYLNITNTDDQNRTYNFSIGVQGTGLNYSINGSAVNSNLNLVNISANRSIQLNLTFWSAVSGIRNVSLLATFWNNSAVVLNSTDDIGYMVVNVTGFNGAGDVNISVNKSVINQSTIYMGNTTQYLINVTNIGTTTITNLTITDTYDVDYNYSNATPVQADNVNYTSRVAIWNNVSVNLASGESYAITVNFSAIAWAAAVSNIANVTARNSTGGMANGSAIAPSVYIFEADKPSINFTAPALATGNYSQSTIWANVSSSDSGSGLNLTFIYLYNSTGLYNSTNGSNVSSLYSNFTGLANGVYTINASAIDNHGNRNWTETRMIILDTVAPTISFGNGATTTGNYSRTWIYINVTASDTLVGLDSMNATLYNATWQARNSTLVAGSSNYTINITAISDGLYYLNVTVNDTANNINRSIQTIILDTVAPNITNGSSTTLVGNYTQNWTFVNISVAEHGLSGISSINLTLYDSTWGAVTSVANTTSFFYNFTNLADGRYYWNATTTDTAGNVNRTSSGGLIILDRTGPVITIHSPRNTTYYNNTNVTLHLSATDAAVGVISTIMYSNNSGETNTTYNGEGSPITNISLPGVGNNYTYYVYANDSLGNKNSTSVTFTIAALSSTQAIVSTNTTTVGANTTQLVIAYNTSVERVTINSSRTSTENVSLDLGQTLTSSGNTTLSSTSNTTLERAADSSGANYSAWIPTGAVIMGGSSWTGDFLLPTIRSTSAYTSPSSGTVDAVVDVGATTELNLSSAAKLTLPVMAGKYASWSRNSTLINITTRCNSGNSTNTTTPTNINSSSPRECFMNDGSNLLIWTYHFTTFAAYTPVAPSETPASNSPGGGSGGAATPLNATNITNMTGPTAPVEGEEESGTGDESDSSQPGAGEQQGGVTGEPEGGNNSWIIWLIAVVVVVVIATVLIVAKKKNK
jgi:hypothetical protein